MDRRSFVSLLTAGTAGQALVSRQARAQTATRRRIVVVGGGMAGTTCAKFLSLWGARTGMALDITLINRDAAYATCIMSNGVLTGERGFDEQVFSYDRLAARPGVRVLAGAVTEIDPLARRLRLDSGLVLPWDRLVLAPGVEFDYSAVIINGRGLSRDAARDEVPHAWKAGPQTQALRAQLVGMRAGRDVVVTVPRSPYRCPPGPYERACVIADWLARNKPGSRVVVLDANPGIAAERVNFGRAFTEIHHNIDYYPNAEIAAIRFAATDLQRKVVRLAAPVTRIDPVSGAALGSAVSSVRAAVVNYIPPHHAGELARAVFGTVAGGLAAGRWIEVDELSYETAIPGIHAVGDAIASKQPKAGHIGNQQAKVCADAILRLEAGLAPYPAPVTNSACYTPITRTTASWLTAVFAYNAAAGEMQVAPPGVVESADGATVESFEGMQHWFAALMDDTFG
ncbi:MAG: NAD(P)/FAD-dependent oxidoreductase [Rhodobacteraceae bacterium]|nr:NAD(P)/FAD-dependent oxidoreductase [Paracoccaceae bacterium]